jgi:hypothetical protein
MAFTIASSVGASMAGATGRPWQGHLVYAQTLGAWWINYLTSTQSLSALYSANNGASWSAPSGSPYTLHAVHGSLCRSFAFGYANIAGTDALHMSSAYSGVLYHSRFTLGTTWANTNAESTTGGNNSQDGGPSACLSTANVPYEGITSTADAYYAHGYNADSGSSWTFSSPTYTVLSGGTPKATAVVPIASGNILFVKSNGSASGQHTNFSTIVYPGGSAANALTSNVTQADDNAWGVCARTTSDVHLVALSDNSSNYVHARFNGTSWSTGNTVPSLAYGANSGLALVSDGTSVWMFAADASSNIQSVKWTSGGGWGSWAVLDATRSNTPSYLTAAYNGSSQVMAAWTEFTGSNYNIVGDVLSTSPASGLLFVPYSLDGLSGFAFGSPLSR